MNNNKPTVGLAFSGASSRSIFYIGFLEVLRANDFPIDFIAAMSAGAVVAASYSCGTLPELKRLAMSLDKEILFNFIERSQERGGLYQLNKVEELIRVYTKNLNFEDVHPRLGFVTTDIATPKGDEVVLQVGDIARAVCASCTLPGVFQPVEWGNKQLVDGGIINVVPGNVARDANVDIVIGVDMRATRHIFSRWQIILKKSINFLKKMLWPSQLDLIWQKLLSSMDYQDFYNDYPEHAYPNMFSVLGKAMDIAIRAQKNHKDETFGCDLLIVPDTSQMPFWKRYLFLHFTDFSNTQEYYKSGKRTAEQYLPKMWQLLADAEQKNNLRDKKVTSLLQKQDNA